MSARRKDQGRDVLKDIAAGRVRSAYVLLGGNSLLVDEIIRRLRDKAVAPGFEPFDYESFGAEEVDVAIAVQHARQQPMGPGRRLVVVKDITRQGRTGPVYCKAGRAAVEQLLDTAAKLPEQGCLVLTGVYKKELVPLLRKCGLKDAVVDTSQPSHGDMLAITRNWARRLKLDLDDDAATLLLDICGGDTAVVKGELEKLATCLEPGEKATAGTVREYAGASREFTLNEYVDRVLSRDAAGALDVLRRLQVWGEKMPRIISWLTTGFLDLVAARADPAGMSSWKMRRVRPMLDRWRDAGELNRCLQQLYRVSRDFFSGRPEEFARLEAFTYCVACRGTPGYCDVYTDGEPHELCMVPPRRRKHG